MHCQRWWLCAAIVFRSWQLALSNSVTVHPVSLIISVEINRRHYFRSIAST
jgi:hypothetical protein